MANEPEPKTLQQAIIYFADPKNCRDYLVARRWPNGVICPTCGRDDVTFLEKQNKWQCKSAHKQRQFSVKVGTIFEDSPLSLDKWLAAVWMVVNCKNGISSYEIARDLGVMQKTAWFMAHRIRLAMQTGSFAKKLSGTVECDETALGGLSRNMHKTKRAARITSPGPSSGKMLVMGLLERHGEVIAKLVPDTDGKTLKAEIRNHVEPGSEIFTDGWGGYKGMDAEYFHDFVEHNDQYVRGRVHTNGIENFWTLLKRTVKGTYVSVEPFHLFRYLDEQSFRFNNRKGNDGERFQKVMGQVAGKRLTLSELTGKSKEADRQAS
jgi:transposase-like protein